MEQPEAGRKEIANPRSEIQGLGIVVGGIAVIGALNYLTVKAGVAQGSRSNIDVGSPLSLLEVVLIPAIFILLIRAAMLRRRNKPINATICIIMVLLIPQLLFMWFGALVYGSASMHATRSREMSNMRTIAAALDSYKTTFAAYPSSLSQAFTGGATVPQSAFGKYEYVTAPGFSGAPRYSIWSCGPDGKFDINPGPDLNAAIAKLPTITNWLTARVYDPTNGSISPGDMIRY